MAEADGWREGRCARRGVGLSGIVISNSVCLSDLYSRHVEALKSLILTLGKASLLSVLVSEQAGDLYDFGRGSVYDTVVIRQFVVDKIPRGCFNLRRIILTSGLERF